MKPIYDRLGAYEICATETYPKFRRVQFRFPRSRKKRIRAKWARREVNWRIEPCDDFIFDMERGTLYCHPDTLKKLKEELAKRSTEVPEPNMLRDVYGYDRFLEPVLSIDEVRRRAEQVRRVLERGMR